MARFILDVDNGNNASESMNIMKEITELLECDYIASISCINHLNDSQFHEDSAKNRLQHKEIENFNLDPHS